MNRGTVVRGQAIDAAAALEAAAIAAVAAAAPAVVEAVVLAAEAGEAAPVKAAVDAAKAGVVADFAPTVADAAQAQVLFTKLAGEAAELVAYLSPAHFSRPFTDGKKRTLVCAKPGFLSLSLSLVSGF